MIPFRPDSQEWQPIRTLLESGLPQTMLAVGASGSLVRQYLDALQSAALCFTPETDGFACGRCRSCALLAEDSHPDLWVIAVEPGKRIAIDVLRQATEWIHFTPQVSAARWLRVDNAEVMTVAAANAILKTLEEPPSRAHLVLHSEQVSQLLPTIRSRLQRLPLPEMQMAESLRWLREQGVNETNSMILLRQFGNRPLRAFEAWEAGWTELRQNWLRTLLDLPGQGIVAALRMAEQWSKSPDILLLRELVLSVLADFMRLHQGMLDRIVHLDYLDELRLKVQGVTPDALRSTLDDWLRLPVTLAQNGNGLIVMEKLLLDWLALWTERKTHGI